MSDEEDVTARLLRLAGAPSEPPADRRARVKDAVHDAWRAHRRQRIVRRASALIVACGVAAASVFVVRLDRVRPVPAPPEAILATSARVQGHPTVSVPHGGARPLTSDTPLHADDVVETDEVSRVSLLMADGSSLRVDRGSRLRFVTQTAIELAAGATYIETSTGSQGFEVRTPMGTVRDLGTRFEARLVDSALRLRVRTGMVQVRRGAAVTAVAAAGTETTVTSAGVAARDVAAFGPDWAWMETLAPPFAIEGHSLRAFLEHVAAEEGWTLRYANPALAKAADLIILHGSVDGLAPEQALEVALATSGLQYRLRAGELFVSKPSDRA